MPALLYYQLTPLVLNQSAPVAPTLEARFDGAPTTVTIHLDAITWSNIQWQALAGRFTAGVDLQLTSIVQKFFNHFDDEYDSSSSCSRAAPRVR